MNKTKSKQRRLEEDSKSVYMLLLDESFTKVAIQRDRINYRLNLKNRSSVMLPMLFADIHFFFIASANLAKILGLLNKKLDDSTLSDVYNKYGAMLKDLKTFRDHFEHIDGRINGRDGDRAPLAKPSMLGNLSGDTYDFCGKKINLSNTFIALDALLEDLKVWNDESRIYSPWYLLRCSASWGAIGCREAGQ